MESDLLVQTSELYEAKLTVVANAKDKGMTENDPGHGQKAHPVQAGQPATALVRVENPSSVANHRECQQRFFTSACKE